MLLYGVLASKQCYAEQHCCGMNLKALEVMIGCMQQHAGQFVLESNQEIQGAVAHYNLKYAKASSSGSSEA